MKKSFSIKNVFITVYLLLIFLFYFKTVFYGIKGFDEITPFKEIHMPICTSFSEIFELISLLGLNHHFEASNTLYSSIISIRSNPFGDFLILITQCLFKKNPIYYHAYSLILHLINSLIVFLLIDKVAAKFLEKSKQLYRYSLIFLLSSLWALHPVNIEAILLLTNYNAILSYTMSLIVCLIYLNYTDKKASTIKLVVLALVFIIGTFIVEYSFLLPYLLLFYEIGLKLIAEKKSYDLRKLTSSKFLVLSFISVLFILLFLFSNNKVNFESQRSLILSLERMFWLSPQIIFHDLKLILFPITLSVDQTSFVQLGKSLFSPYPIFCICLIFAMIFFSAMAFFSKKKMFSFIYLAFIPFLISIIPFSHILAPLYNLASERYLYLPSFFLIFGISHTIFYFASKSDIKINTIIIFLLAVILSAYGIRSYMRTLDWENSFTLYNSAIKSTSNPLYKAFRFKMLTPQEKIFSKYPHREVPIYFQELAITNLNAAIEDLQSQQKRFQHTIPLIVKSYGLDPQTLLAKAAYLLGHSDYILNNNPAKALSIMQTYVKDLGTLDNAGLAFYSSLYFFTDSTDKAEHILKYAYKKYPHSIRITLPLCQLLFMKNESIEEAEKHVLETFNYFPYDAFTMLFLTKIYKLKNDPERFAFFSYAYGLRNHSIDYLENARSIYLKLGKLDAANKIEKAIARLKNK